MRLSSAGFSPQPEEGEKRVLNSELWHACAGPLVSLPAVGSRVIYFPQGHSEQVAASTNKDVDAPTPNYPSLPPQIICQLHNVTMHAHAETDEEEEYGNEDDSAVHQTASVGDVEGLKNVIRVPATDQLRGHWSPGEGIHPSKTSSSCNTMRVNPMCNTEDDNTGSCYSPNKAGARGGSASWSTLFDGCQHP